MTWFGEPPPRNILAPRDKLKKLSAEMIERMRTAKTRMQENMAEKKALELSLKAVKDGDLWKFVINKDDVNVEWVSSAALFTTEDAARGSGTELIKTIKNSPVKLVTYL